MQLGSARAHTRYAQKVAIAMLESWFSSNSIELAPVERSAEAQRQVDAQTAELALYHYDSCMFCARVRKAIVRLSLNIELRDVLRDTEHRRDLHTHGGSTTVPCLRIGTGEDAKWMYESADIVAYLTRRFGTAAGAPAA